MRPNLYNNHLSISAFACSLHITDEPKANVVPLIYQPNVLPQKWVYVPFNAKFGICPFGHESRVNLPALKDKVNRRFFQERCRKSRGRTDAVVIAHLETWIWNPGSLAISRLCSLSVEGKSESADQVRALMRDLSVEVAYVTGKGRFPATFCTKPAWRGSQLPSEKFAESVKDKLLAPKVVILCSLFSFDSHFGLECNSTLGYRYRKSVVTIYGF